MFDIAWSEMVLIGAVALVVIGPKDLPKALRTVGQAIGKVRRMASEFQGQFNEAMREAELADLKKQVEDVGGSVSSALNNDFKPIDPIKEFEAPKSEDAAKTEAAMKEAEAKLAALPLPEPLPPVAIGTEAAKPAEKPKRARKAKAEEAVPAVEAAAVPAPVEAPAPAKPARTRAAKTAKAPVEAKPVVEAARPARKRKQAAAKTAGAKTAGEETSA